MISIQGQVCQEDFSQYMFFNLSFAESVNRYSESLQSFKENFQTPRTRQRKKSHRNQIPRRNRVYMILISRFEGVKI